MTVASLWNPITDIGKSAANAVFGALWSEIGNAAQAVTSALVGRHHLLHRHLVHLGGLEGSEHPAPARAWCSSSRGR